MPTDQERMAAYQDCVNKLNDASLRTGLGFVSSILQGDVPGAAMSWAQMILDAANNNTDCMQLLTPEQRQQVIAAAQRLHQQYIDDQNNLKGPAFGSNL